MDPLDLLVKIIGPEIQQFANIGNPENMNILAQQADPVDPLAASWVPSQ